MMKEHKTRSKVKPREIAFVPEKPKRGIHSNPIYRLAQNSRRVPPSAFVIQRDSSIFLSFVLVLNKVWVACISRRRIEQNLYEELAHTINEIEEGAQKTDEELSALKNHIKNQYEVSKNDGRK